jgi:MoaA/NifB/PqqE/SkfB family radical SAM enzyme
MDGKIVNQNAVEIIITNDCDMKCPNCAHSCALFPSKEYMSLDSIRNFVDQSLELNYIWNKISLTGGEASLHPDFFEVLDIVSDYKRRAKGIIKKFVDKCVIDVATHGCTKRSNDIVSKINNPEVVVKNSMDQFKEPLQKFKYHFDFYVAPIDLEEYKGDDFSKFCFYPYMCGVSYSNRGFYPCSVSAHIDRVMNLDMGLPSLIDVKNTNMSTMMKYFCKYCGIYRAEKKHGNMNEKMSLTWQKAYKKYHEKIEKDNNV